jgi:hypothetical protein
MRKTLGNPWMNAVLNDYTKFAGRVVLILNQTEVIDDADSYLSAIALAKEKYPELKPFISFFWVPATGFLNAQFKLFRVRTIKENVWIPDYMVFVKDKRDEWQGFDMLVDSGADFCFVNYKFGKDILGFELSSNEVIRKASGIGGDVDYIYRLMTLKIGQQEVKAEVAWCLDEEIPDLIIGRKDVFDAFIVTFDQRKTQIYFEPYSTENILDSNATF